MIDFATKKCSKCKQEKPLTEFSFRKDQNRYRSWCKACHNEYYRGYFKRRYHNDPEFRQRRLRYSSAFGAGYRAGLKKGKSNA